MKRTILLACWVVLLAAPAWAQTAPPEEPPPAEQPPAAEEPPLGTTPPPQERAKALAQEGAKLAAGGQFSEACAKFEQSLLVYPMTDVFYNLGYCYEQTGNWQGCKTNYEKYIQSYKKAHDGADPHDIIGVRRSIEKCTEVAQPPITVTSTPEGAQVAIGSKDRIIGATPLTQKLEPGTYTIFVMKDSYATVQTQIVVQPKQPGKFHFDLRKEVKAGTVRIRVNVRDATIYIDGKNYGLSPYMETPELSVGRHQVVIKKERYSSVNQTFEVTDGQVTELDVDLYLTDPPPSWRSYLGWASVSIGAVALAGGIVAYKFADEEFNDTDDFDQLKLLQNIGYGAGGGLMGLGIGLLIWEAFTDAVDSDDLIEEASGPAMMFGATPVQGGVYLQGVMRF